MKLFFAEAHKYLAYHEVFATLSNADGVLQLNLVESALTAWSKPCLNPALVLKGMLDNDTTDGHMIVKMLRDALAKQTTSFNGGALAHIVQLLNV